MEGADGEKIEHHWFEWHYLWLKVIAYAWSHPDWGTKLVESKTGTMNARAMITAQFKATDGTRMIRRARRK